MLVPARPDATDSDVIDGPVRTPGTGDRRSTESLVESSARECGTSLALTRHMKTRLAALAILALVPTVASAQAPSTAPRTIAVFEPVGIGVDAAQVQTVGELARDEFSKRGYRVTPRSAMPEGTCADELCAAEKGKALGVSEAVIMKLSRLETKVLVIAALIDVPSGRVEFSDRATAASLDDMDALVPRVVQSLSTREPFASTITPSTVTLNESREQQREKAFFTTGLRLSGIIPVGGSYAGATSLWGAEWVNYYEVRQYSIEAALGVRGSSNDPKVSVAEFYADLGGYYYLRDKDVSPFVGGGVGLHSVSASWDDGVDVASGTPIRRTKSETGTALWGGFGATLLRTADVHVVGVAKYTIDLVNIDGQPAHGVMLGVAVTYTKRGACCLW